MSKYMLPGLGVGVSRKGQTVWEEAFGLADIENDVPTERFSVWRMASISKALTSALVGHLIDERRLDLHESIHSYLTPNVFPIKQWNGRNVSITLDQLMSHTAGLRVTDDQKDFQRLYYYKNVSHSLIQFKDEPLIAEPGTQFNYSNFGYQVVGAVIEAVLNQTFDKAIDDMFRRLSMNSTFCETNQMIIKHRVRGYMTSNSPYLKQNSESSDDKSKVRLLNTKIIDDILPIVAEWPSGAIVSSTSDLLTFGNYLLNRYKAPENDTSFDYLSPNSVKKIWSPVIESYHDDIGSFKRAHGWVVTDLDKRPIDCTGHCKLPSKMNKIIWKSGGLFGVMTLIMVVPEQDLVVTVVTNNSGGFETEFMNIFEVGLIVAKNFMI